MVLPILKEVKKVISFAKSAFTGGGFRHVQGYLSGLISLGKKTVKKISEAIVGENHHSAISRMLDDAKFEKDLLEKRYLKKLNYLFKNSEVYLIFDDTLVKREGEKVMLTKKHYDHSNGDYVQGHQFFTSMLYTKFVQIPLFPELFSDESPTKIEMAKSLLEKLLQAKIKLHTALFDSWYSDEKIIKQCRNMGVRVICGIKTNRNVKFKRGRKYWSLSFITKRISPSEKHSCIVDNTQLRVVSYQIHLHKIPNIQLIISHKYNKKNKEWDKLHLINTNKKDSIEETLLAYKTRWAIETCHRDMKQNLGFASPYFRKESGIVRHSILVTLAYTILQLYMFQSGNQMTIGQCCEHLTAKNLNDLIEQIVIEPEESNRNHRFQEVFITKTAKV